MAQRGGGGYEETDPEESPFMRPEFVLSEEPNEPPLERSQQRVNLNRRPCSRGSNQSPTITSEYGSSRHGSPFRKPGAAVRRPSTDEKNDNASYTKAANLPDDVREQVRSLLTEDDPLQATNCSRSMAPLISEPTRLSAQPTVEEIQMCFAQIDLSILMETKPTLAPRRFTSPNANDRRASPLTRPCPPVSANPDNAPEYAPRICAHRAFRSPPRLVIPKWNENSASESDTSSINIHPDVVTEAYKAAAVTPELDTMNDVVNEVATRRTSRMQQLLIDRANMRRKSAAVAAAVTRTSNDDRPVIGRSSHASSPAATTTSPLTPSSMQQQLVQRANMRRSLQANMTSTEDTQHDAAIRRSTERDNARAFTSPMRNTSADKRRSTPDHYEEAQMTFSGMREDFLQKLKQIQELAVTGARGSPSGSNYGIEASGNESSTNDKEKKRAYQNPVWTHRSCSSSSLNGGRYRTQEEDNLCLDTFSTDIESP